MLPVASSSVCAAATYLELAGNEGMERNMDSTIMGYIGATIMDPFLHS